MTRDDVYRGLPVLVLGANGFIGRWVTAELSRRGAEVHAGVRDLDRARDGLAAFRLYPTLHRFEAQNRIGLSQLLATLQPAIVFNLAGYGVDPRQRNAQEAQRVNIDLVGQLVSDLAENPAPKKLWSGQRLIHVGSAAEYGAVGGDLSETGPCAPSGVYGETKLRGTKTLEELAASQGLAGLTARLFTVYGAGESSGRLLPSLIRVAREGGVLELTDGHQQRDFTAVDQVARVLVQLAEVDAPPGRVVNVASGVLTRVRDFVGRAATVLGIESDRLLFGALPGRPDEMSHDPVNIDRLRELGIEAPDADLEAGVKRALDLVPRMHHEE